MVTIDDYWLSFLIATALPALVALITQRFASGLVKSLTLLLLSVISGTLASIQATGGMFEWRSTVTSVFISFITAVVAHYGLLKPAGVTGSQGVVARKSPSGVGRGRHRA